MAKGNRTYKRDSRGRFASGGGGGGGGGGGKGKGRMSANAKAKLGRMANRIDNNYEKANTKTAKGRKSQKTALRAVRFLEKVSSEAKKTRAVKAEKARAAKARKTNPDLPSNKIGRVAVRIAKNSERADGTAKGRKSQKTASKAIEYVRGVAKEGKRQGLRGAKAGMTKALNSARARELKAKGTVLLGDRIKAKGFSGGKAAQARAGGLKKRGLEAAEKMAKGGSKVSTVGRGGRAARMAAISKIRNKGRR